MLRLEDKIKYYDVFNQYLEIDMETICRKDYWYFHRILEYITSNVNIMTMWEKTSITTA